MDFQLLKNKLKLYIKIDKDNDIFIFYGLKDCETIKLINDKIIINYGTIIINDNNEFICSNIQ